MAVRIITRFELGIVSGVYWDGTVIWFIGYMKTFFLHKILIHTSVKNCGFDISTKTFTESSNFNKHEFMYNGIKNYIVIFLSWSVFRQLICQEIN